MPLQCGAQPAPAVAGCLLPSLRAADASACLYPVTAGKREASIRGADVGGKTAAKLLARYHTLEAVLAAAADGQLKGWGPAVQHLLEGGGSKGGTSISGGGGGSSTDWQARLRRNRQLFAASAEPAVVDARGMQALHDLLTVQQQPPAARPWDDSNGAGGSCSGSSGAIEAPATLAWLHPLHARRWRSLQQLSQAASQQGVGSASWQPRQAATPQGLAVDRLAGDAAGGGDATFVVCPADLQAGAWPKALAAAAQQQCEGRDDAQSRLLMPLLHGGMRHHVRLVQRAGFRVQLQLPPVELPLLAAAAGEAAQGVP